MVFASKDKKKEDKKDGDKPADDAKKSEDGGEGAKSDEPPADAPTPAEGDGDSAAGDGPPPIEEKPGGCGCKVAGGAGHGSLGLLLALLGAVAIWARRRAA